MAADDSVKKLKRRNKTPNNKAAVITNSQPEENHNRSIDKKIKKKKKKPSADVLENSSSKMFEPSDTGDEASKASGGNKKREESRNKKRKNTKLVDNEQGEGKIKSMKKVKRKRSLDAQRVDDSEEPNTLTEQDDEDVGSMIKPETIDHMTISEGSEGAKSRRSKTGKSKRNMKKKNKSLADDVTRDKVPKKQESAPETEVQTMTLDKQEEASEVEVYEMSSGDEDYSNGMRKWIMQYHQSRPGIKVLQDRIDDFIMDHEARKEQARLDHKAESEKDGFTVVEHHRGRKKTTDAESGVAVGSVASAAVLDNMAKKKSKDVGLDFYRFQKREAQKSELMMLQSKFEQDKKRIQQLRAERKFRPY